MFGHPPFDALKRFADAEIEERERSRVARHLEGCGKCRDEVMGLRELRTLARALPSAELSPGAFDQIVSRRASGDRVILPAEHQEPLRPVRRPALLAAAAVLVMLLGWAVLSPSGGLEAGISGGELTFSDTMPVAGAVVRVSYLPAAALADETRLRLRGQLFTSSSRRTGGGAIIVAELQRQRDGRYAGAFTLPDSVVYALLAVEDERGARVDANGRAYWELLVHDTQQRPLEDALWQRFTMSVGRDWTTGDQSIRRMVALYPESPRGHRFLLSNDVQRLGQAARDSILEVMRPRFVALHERYAARPDVASEVVFEMIFFAGTLRDTERQAFWRERALQDFPNEHGTVQQKVFAVHQRRLSPAETLAELDSLWEQHGQGTPQLLLDGWQLAERSGSTTALQRWGERVIASDMDWASAVGAAWVEHAELRDAGLALLRRGLARVDSLHEAQRPLDQTVAEYRRSRGGWKQNLLMSIASAHMHRGETGAALDTLRRAVELGWNPRVDRLLSQSALAAGDTAAAVRALTRVAADPSTPRAWTDSVRSAYSAHAPAREWSTMVAAADSAMRQDVLARSRRQRTPAAMHVVQSDGSPRRLAFADEGVVTVVAFISRFCPPSNALLPSLAEAGQALERRGVRLLIVTSEQPSGELRNDLIRLGYEGPVLHDPRAELARGLRQFATPQLFVIDQAGLLRQDGWSLPAAMQMASALQGVPIQELTGPAAPARMAAPASP